METANVNRGTKDLKEQMISLVTRTMSEALSSDQLDMPLVDMGITPHIPTQNRTCAINAYGFSPYIPYTICKINSL